MIPSIAVGVVLVLFLVVWWDWFTTWEFDREIAKFFDDNET